MATNDGAPDTSRGVWIVRDGDDRIEAPSFDALVPLVASGQLRAESYIYDPSSRQWRYASEIPELRAALQNRAGDDAAWIVNLGGRSAQVRDLDTLRNWVHDFRIEPTTKIRNPHLQRWMNAGDVLELGAAFSSRPEITFDPPRAAGGFPPLLAAVLTAIAVLAAVAFYSATRPKAPRPTVAAAPVTGTATPAEPATVRPPRMNVLTFGKAPDGTSTITSTALETATATTGTIVEAKAAAVPPPPLTATTPAEQPAAARDDAEIVDQEEDGDVLVRGNDAIRVTTSGDTKVAIDRSGRDAHYHLPGCSNLKGDIATVSLDLARQGRSACPVCRPPG